VEETLGLSNPQQRLEAKGDHNGQHLLSDYYIPGTQQRVISSNSQTTL